MTKLEYDFIITKDKARSAKGYLTYRERKILDFMINNPKLLNIEVDKKSEETKVEPNADITTNIEPVKEEIKKVTPITSIIPTKITCLKCNTELHPPKGTVQLYCNKICRKIYRRLQRVR